MTKEDAIKFLESLERDSNRQDQDYYECYIGPWRLGINPRKWIKSDYEYDYNGGHFENCDCKLSLCSKHIKFSIFLYQKARDGEDPITIDKSPLFKNYLPIQYIRTKTSSIYDRDGDNISKDQLIELIIYLHQLSNLSVFI